MKNSFRTNWILPAMLLLLLFACSDPEADLQQALDSVQLQDYAGDIETLASDEFEGRSPSSPGEEKTINFLKSRFEALGVQPGNGDSFFQEVPLVAINSTPEKFLNVRRGRKTLGLRLGDEFVAVTRHVEPEILLNDAPLVFAGYGIVAPEQGWNDYAGIDVKGKIVVVLVNDPGYASGDSLLFRGRTMTYYGRWTYKYEEAARRGAAGVLIVHQTAAAGYPWAVVESGWTGRQFYLESDDGNRSRAALEGWISEDAARRLFQFCGADFDADREAAGDSDFRPRALEASATLKISNQIEHSLSHNVVAVLPGTDRKDEYIIYTAHWDHFGVNPGMEGDNIYNGARDNATGTAALLELARTFQKLKERPQRSILFMAVTAEEQGLLGSAYYADHPIFPLSQTVAVLNMDALNIWGPMKDITIIGRGNSELDRYVIAAAVRQGRYLRADPQPEKGSFYRSDHFSFAKHGVPSLYTRMGIDHVEHGPEWTLEQMDHWTAEFYHKPGDEYDPSWWDLRGAIDDIRLLFMVGYELSRESTFPNWKEGNEFKRIRDASRAAAGR